MNSLTFVTQIQRNLKKLYIGKLLKNNQFNYMVKEYEKKKASENKTKKRAYVEDISEKEQNN